MIPAPFLCPRWSRQSNVCCVLYSSSGGLTLTAWAALLARDYSGAVQRSPLLPKPPESVPTIAHQESPGAAWVANPDRLAQALASAVGPVVLPLVGALLHGDALVGAVRVCSGPPLPPQALLEHFEGTAAHDPVSVVQCCAILEDKYRSLPDGLPEEARDRLGLPSAMARCLDLYATYVYEVPEQLRIPSAASSAVILCPDMPAPPPGHVAFEVPSGPLLATLSGYLSLGAVAAAARLAAVLASMGVAEPVVRSTLLWARSFPQRCRLDFEARAVLNELIASFPGSVT